MTGVPINVNPLLQLNLATLPCWFHLVLTTEPFSGALALMPVHFVGVQLPLCVAPFQVIVPPYPILQAHEMPGALFEFAMRQGATVKQGGHHICHFTHPRTNPQLHIPYRNV